MRGIPRSQAVLPETHPLIEAVTKPLADNVEQRLAANAMLEENFDENHAAIPQTLTRFQEIDAGKVAGFWKWLLPVLAGISLIMLGISLVPKMRSILILNSHFGSSILRPPAEKLRSDLTPEQNLLLGDPQKPLLRQKQDLTQSDPRRPDFYADFVAQYISSFKKLPPDYFETVARIDPENTYFLYLGAAIVGKDSVDAIRRTEDEKQRNDLIRYDLLDEKRLADALVLFHQARSLPRFDNYGSSLLAERIPLLKQSDPTERIASIGYVAGQSAPSVWLRELVEMVAAEFARLAENGDTPGIRRLMDDNEHFLKTWASSPVGSLIDEMVLTVAVAGTTAAASDAAAKARLDDEVARLRGRKTRVDERIEWRKRTTPPDHVDTVSSEGSMFANLLVPSISGRHVRIPVPITSDELRPGRLVDHEIASQICLAASVVLLLLASVAVFLFRFRAPRPARKVASRLLLLLDRTDWLWILGCGFLLPFLYVILINRFTPLGGREHRLGYYGLLFPFSHYLLLFLCTLSAPTLLVRWRLRKRAAPFALTKRTSVVGWLALTIALACVPGLYFFATRFANETVIQILFLVPSGLLVLTILIGSARALFGKRHARVTRAATAEALIPAYSLGILLLALLYPLVNTSERQWFAKDKFTNLDPEYPAMTPYEYKTGVRIRKDTNAVLGLEQ